MNPDKMRRIITELKESNGKLSARAKEQKTALDEQGKLIQDKDGEIREATDKPEAQGLGVQGALC